MWQLRLNLKYYFKFNVCKSICNSAIPIYPCVLVMLFLDIVLLDNFNELSDIVYCSLNLKVPNIFGKCWNRHLDNNPLNSRNTTFLSKNRETLIFIMLLKWWNRYLLAISHLPTLSFTLCFDLKLSTNKVICFWIHHMANIIKKSQKNQFYFLKITFCNFFSGHLQVNKSENSLELLQFGCHKIFDQANWDKFLWLT